MHRRTGRCRIDEHFVKVLEPQPPSLAADVHEQRDAVLTHLLDHLVHLLVPGAWRVGNAGADADAALLQSLAEQRANVLELGCSGLPQRKWEC